MAEAMRRGSSIAKVGAQLVCELDDPRRGCLQVKARSWHRKRRRTVCADPHGRCDRAHPGLRLAVLAGIPLASHAIEFLTQRPEGLDGKAPCI
jgi:hypothetical protein